MKSLQVKSHKAPGYVEVRVDDDVYEKYKSCKFRHMVSGDMGSSYVNMLDEDTGKWVSFPRRIMSITDRKSYIIYNDDDETNLERSNLRIASRGDINRTRPPKFYGRMFKGTSYNNGIWYSVVYLPGGQKFMKRCTSEPEAALVYDSTLNYLELPGYRNFPEAGTKHLSADDIQQLNEKTRRRIRRC